MLNKQIKKNTIDVVQKMNKSEKQRETKISNESCAKPNQNLSRRK